MKRKTYAQKAADIVATSRLLTHLKRDVEKCPLCEGEHADGLACPLLVPRERKGR